MSTSSPASPATGSYRRHNAEQDFVMRMSLGEVTPAKAIDGTAPEIGELGAE